METILDEDEHGKYIELDFSPDMSPIVLDEEQWNSMPPAHIATMRVYISAAAKRAVVVKEDDLLSKQDFVKHAKEVEKATVAEISTWLDNRSAMQPTQNKITRVSKNFVPLFKTNLQKINQKNDFSSTPYRHTPLPP